MRKGELVVVETEDGMNDFLSIVNSVDDILEACTFGYIMSGRNADGIIELSDETEPIPWGMIKKVIREPREIMAELDLRPVETFFLGQLVLAPADLLESYDPLAPGERACAVCQRLTAHVVTAEKSSEKKHGSRRFLYCCLTDANCYRTVAERLMRELQAGIGGQ